MLVTCDDHIDCGSDRGIEDRLVVRIGDRNARLPRLREFEVDASQEGLKCGEQVGAFAANRRLEASWRTRLSFERIAIVNRGEAAMRFIHAVRDLRAAGERIGTVALFTDVERNARFVWEADAAYPLGPASARPYLNLALLERALVETGADRPWRA